MINNDRPFLCAKCGKVGRVIDIINVPGGGRNYKMWCDDCGEGWGVNRWLLDGI